MKPLIAITPEAITLKSRIDGRGAFCGVSYSQAIELAGGIPMILPLTSDRKVLGRFLAGCNGLMLAGGGDVNPNRYRAKLTVVERESLSGMDDIRDAMEIYLIRQAVGLDVPVFGICRGIQLMNVAFGGTLIPDLTGHRNPKPDALAHRLEWTKPTQLLVCERVNTSHHQAVDRIADGFEVVARAADGVVEAMEWPGKRFCCAVQFHPERLLKVAPQFLRLFEVFVNSSRRERNQSRLRVVRSAPADCVAGRTKHPARGRTR